MEKSYLRLPCMGGTIDADGKFVRAKVKVPGHNKWVETMNFRAPDQKSPCFESVFLPGTIRDDMFVPDAGVFPDNPEITAIRAYLRDCLIIFIVSAERCEEMCWKKSRAMQNGDYDITNGALRERMAEILGCEPEDISRDDVEKVARHIDFELDDGDFMGAMIESAGVGKPAAKPRSGPRM